MTPAVTGGDGDRAAAGHEAREAAEGQGEQMKVVALIALALGLMTLAGCSTDRGAILAQCRSDAIKAAASESVRSQKTILCMRMASYRYNINAASTCRPSGAAAPLTPWFQEECYEPITGMSALDD